MVNKYDIKPSEYNLKKKVLAELSSYLLILGVNFDYSFNTGKQEEELRITQCTKFDLERIMKRYSGFYVDYNGLIVSVYDIECLRGSK